MKIPVIKKLVANYSVEELEKAEEALGDEQKPQIEIDGEDEGEMLTHAYAAIWVKNKMIEDNMEFREAMRAFTQKVRKSIS
ncbi:DUF6952 family protein [Sediminitomix flava]|uniref:Uncharacterized protein n=1 Tax=Sediminitomix flava TaxID=379075 RepID=A0A315Z9G7_SEDFL|nr:hypothetical protein [Sediminitomix flava]PWJ42196.1 hypothetical protein BC781_103447 [Sediminitomix flava]